MTCRPILLHPDPRLKKACDPVTEITDAIHTLAADMLETMYDAPGIGLAAPQVGVMRRVMVMDCIKDEDATPRPMVLLNPEITWLSEETSVYEEGCLSIPEHYADVERPARVTVRWTSLDGTQAEETFADLWSTCVQHEIDHLDGKLFLDHLKPLKRQIITRKMVKLKKSWPAKAAHEVALMSARPLLRWPDPRLRTVAADVGAVTDAERAIWDEMVDVMEAMPGVGLAAVQIGAMQRLAVVDASERRGQAVRMANPEVLHSSIEMRIHEEASPNLPGVSAPISRPRAVTVRFLNADGEIEDRDFVGLWATSVQHQIDHLAGAMYFDRLSRTKREMLLRRARRA